MKRRDEEIGRIKIIIITAVFCLIIIPAVHGDGAATPAAEPLDDAYTQARLMLIPNPQQEAAGESAAAGDYEPVEIAVAESPRGVWLKAWGEALKSDNSVKRCLFSVSFDRGNTWRLIQEPAHGFLSCANPAVAADKNGTFYRVAMFFNGDRKARLQISRSRDDGSTWTRWSPIAKDDIQSGDYPQLSAAGDGQLNLVYTEELGLMNINTTYSSDGGKTWAKPETLSEKRGRIGLKRLDAGSFFVRGSDGSLLGSWAGYDDGAVYFARSVDQGRNFTKIQVATTGLLRGVPPSTRILTDPSDASHLTLLWYETHGFNKISLIETRDGGKSWGAVKALASSGTMASGVMDKNGRFHFIWMEYDAENHRGEAKYAVMKSLGDMPGKVISLSEGTFMASPFYVGDYQALLSSSDGSLTAFWLDWRGPRAELRQTRLPAD